MYKSISIPLFLLFGLHLVAAQFGNFFENMWGQQHHQQQQQRSGASQWAAYSDSGVLYFKFIMLLPFNRHLHNKYLAPNISVQKPWTAWKDLSNVLVLIQKMSNALYPMRRDIRRVALYSVLEGRMDAKRLKGC